MLCQEEGAFTKRLSAETEIQVIGGTDKYIAACRRCHAKSTLPIPTINQTQNLLSKEITCSSSPSSPLPPSSPITPSSPSTPKLESFPEQEECGQPISPRRSPKSPRRSPKILRRHGSKSHLSPKKLELESCSTQNEIPVPVPPLTTQRKRKNFH